MTLESILIFLAIGLAAGWVASRLLGDGGRGLLGFLVLGVVGAFVGSFLFRYLGIGHHGLPHLVWQFLAALAGAIALLLLARLLKLR